MASQNTIADDGASSFPPVEREDLSQPEANSELDKAPSPSATGDDPTQSEVTPDSDNTFPTSLTVISLLNSIESKLTPPQVYFKELALLEKIHRQLQSESTKKQFIWNAFLQISGITFAVIFGAFAIIAFRIGEQANIQSSQANQLALLSLCFTSNSVRLSRLHAVFALTWWGINRTLPPLVTVVMGPGPALLPNSTTTPPKLTGSDKIVLGVGIACSFVAFLLVGFFGYWTKALWDERFNVAEAITDTGKKDTSRVGHG